ncbi:hypothetical protein C8A03DRAFT_15293 [Achaetomium macrosporum]|uniref:Ring-like domain-containing protein n=1 Tax=Achaetomium macrosporum TaxID=79813 RepID=A0AAN7CA37_9PEZI|nr:hypothetical protein C8A03DRAFT_15293 [Achaetomium macrosporum]
MAPLFKKHKEAEKAVKDKKRDDKSQETKSPDDASHPAASDGVKPAPLLDDEDEQFLERLVSASDNEEEEGPPPPLPPRPKTPVLTWDSDSESFREPDTKEPSASTTTATKRPNRLSRLFHRSKPSSSNSLTVPTSTVPPDEEDREWADLNRLLSRLDLQPTATATSRDANSKKAKAKAAALTASAEVQSLLRQFVLVLKDIMRGAPTAVDDLVALLDGRNDALKRGFDKLPSSMQKLVTQLPKKLTSALGPEVLAAAAEAQGLKGKRDTDKGFKSFFMPRNLGDLVMTPAVVQSMLKAIVNALKVRWPAFVGTNVLWSAAVFLLLFVLWYCHKRGREEREKRKGEADGTGDVEEKANAEVTGDGVEAGPSAVVVVEPPAESPRSQSDTLMH